MIHPVANTPQPKRSLYDIAAHGAICSRLALARVRADTRDPEQVKRGLAWHFKRYEREQSAEDRADCPAAEVEAREAGRGLWRERMPVPPREWREGQRKQQRTAAAAGDAVH